MNNNNSEHDEDGGESQTGNDFGFLEETLFVSVDENVAEAAEEEVDWKDGLTAEEVEILSLNNAIDIYDASVEADCVFEDNENEENEDPKLENDLISNYFNHSIFGSKTEPDDTADPDFDDTIEAGDDVDKEDEEFEEDDDGEDDWSEDIRHEYEKTPYGSGGQFVCHVCQKSFKAKAALHNHLLTHTGLKPIHCKYCDDRFTTDGEMVRHVKYRHTHEKPHRCKECTYACVEASHLRRHMSCHTGERPFQCEHCVYAASDLFKLRRHHLVHTGEKPFHCEICDKQFSQSNTLKTHRLIHLGNKPLHYCDHCPSKFGRKIDLRGHRQKMHLVLDDPVSCPKCRVFFLDRWSLKVHKRQHKNQKPYRCALCVFSSVSRPALQAHELIHKGFNPFQIFFQCANCEKSFRRETLLRRHHNLYHDPSHVPPTPKEKTHFCPHCRKPFCYQSNMLRHSDVCKWKDEEKPKKSVKKTGKRKTGKRGKESTRVTQVAQSVSVAPLETAAPSASLPKILDFSSLVYDSDGSNDSTIDLEIKEPTTEADCELETIIKLRKYKFEKDFDFDDIVDSVEIAKEEDEIDFMVELDIGDAQGGIEIISVDDISQFFNLVKTKEEKDLDKQKDLETCFGFDDDEENNNMC